jgi:hypothetical protein
VFLTDHILLVGMCGKSWCNLATFDVSDRDPRPIALLKGTPYCRAILRGRDGGIVLSGVRKGSQTGVILLDLNLQNAEWIPRLPDISATGEKIPEGEVRMLGRAGNVAAYLDRGEVRIRSFDGRLLGAFRADTSDRKAVPLIEFLPQERLLFQGTGGLKVVNYNGKVLRTLKWKEHGWMGNKIMASPEANRAVLDSFTRQVGPVRQLLEKGSVLLTMGMSGDGDVPNSEIVRVIDTVSGRDCFEWRGTAKLLPPFGAHADINPSGRLVAILTADSLAIYRVPDSCTAN